MMSTHPKFDQMSEDERLAVLERLLAHLRFGSEEAGAAHDLRFQEQIDEVELLLQDHCLEIARGSTASSELVVSEAIRILSSYYLKHGLPAGFGQLN
jgi:hypothetical protein